MVVERLVLGEGRWERCALLTENRGSLGAAAVDGVIYAVGGGGLNANLASCERLQPAALAWEPVAAMETPRHALAVCADPSKGRIYASGGWVYGNKCTGVSLSSLLLLLLVRRGRSPTH